MAEGGHGRAKLMSACRTWDLSPPFSAFHPYGLGARVKPEVLEEGPGCGRDTPSKTHEHECHYVFSAEEEEFLI